MQARQAFAATGGADVRVLSNSWGGRSFSQALRDEIAATADADMLFVAAAGNDGFSNDILPTYPASYDVANIISVAATTNTDTRASFSNYGAASVDLGAPGVDILSTTIGNAYGLFERHLDGDAARVRRRGAGAVALRARHRRRFEGTLLSTVEPVACAGVADRDRRTPRRQQRASVRAWRRPMRQPTLAAIGRDARWRSPGPAAPGATGFTVKRSETSGGPYARSPRTSTGKTFIDTTVVNDRTYYYVVVGRQRHGRKRRLERSDRRRRRPHPTCWCPHSPCRQMPARPRTVAASVTTRNQGTGASVPTTTTVLAVEEIR